MNAANEPKKQQKSIAKFIHSRDLSRPKGGAQPNDAFLRCNSMFCHRIVPPLVDTTFARPYTDSYSKKSVRTNNHQRNAIVISSVEMNKNKILTQKIHKQSRNDVRHQVHTHLKIKVSASKNIAYGRPSSFYMYNKLFFLGAVCGRNPKRAQEFHQTIRIHTLLHCNKIRFTWIFVFFLKDIFYRNALERACVVSVCGEKRCISASIYSI